MFHMRGITPEAALFTPPAETISITRADLDAAIAADDLTAEPGEVDFVSLGCPHLSIAEIARIAALLQRQEGEKDLLDHHRPPHQTDRRPAGLYADRSRKAAPSLPWIPAAWWLPSAGASTPWPPTAPRPVITLRPRIKFKTRIRPFDEVVAEALR